MTFLGALRRLVLGETWTLPLGVLIVLSACVAIRVAAPAIWNDAGGFLLIIGVTAVLTGSVARSTRPPRARALPNQAEPTRAELR